MPDELVAEAERLAGDGVRELTLLGQNVNSYGRDLPPDADRHKTTFSELLTRIDAIEGIDRIRYTSPHPKDMKEDVIRAHAELPSLCEHIHLPLQSGSSAVLKRMRRTYGRERYMDRVALIREHVPDCAITTDIIVGFPGETEEEFQATLALLDQVEYDSLFSFKYSPRPNTAALAMEDKISEEEKTRRITIVNEKQRAIQIRRNSGLIGTIEEVMVEGRNEALGQWIGRTSQNRTLNFTRPVADGESLTGKYVPVRVTRAGPNSLVGEGVMSVV
jgi:tRNA-2-methylthio-N6-dimethylallyladenosine synthase